MYAAPSTLFDNSLLTSIFRVRLGFQVLFRWVLTPLRDNSMLTSILLWLKEALVLFRWVLTPLLDLF